VLWSIVQGEQLEYPITLSFLTDLQDFTFEAVIVEGANLGKGKIPYGVQPSGIQTNLQLRIPTNRGTWDSAQAYSREEVVKDPLDGLIYKRSSGIAVIDAVNPSESDDWEIWALNKLFVQFPATFSDGWTQQPGPDKPSYGFFEIRVTQPNSVVYQHTWKPIRGLVEVLFSPTHIVT
jgi:hypothetical protein